MVLLLLFSVSACNSNNHLTAGHFLKINDRQGLMAWGSPSQSLIPRKCSVPQSLMLKYPINCKSSHNHILDLNNSLKMHSLVCILEMAKRAHNVPKRYTSKICSNVGFFLFYLFHCLLQKAQQHTIEQGGVGRESHILYIGTSTAPALNMSLSEIYLLSHWLP